MPPRYLLSESAKIKIERQVDQLFDRLLGRFVGPGPKVLTFEVIHDPVLSLPGVFLASAVEGGTQTPNKELLSSLLRISANYLNGIRERTKAQVLNQVESAVARTGTEGMAEPLKDLEGQLAAMWTTVTADIKRVVQTETANATSEGLYDGIAQATSSVGIQDPVVFKVVVRDDLLCDVCKKLWLLDNGITPRAYHLSELQHGYMTDHRNPYPTNGPSHPHCRCILTVLMPGFGFDSAGLVTWVAPDHDELQKQRR